MIEPVLMIELIVTAAVVIGLAMFLGYLGQKWMGVLILGISALFATTLCLVGTIMGYNLQDEQGAWLGLLAGIVLAVPVITLTLGMFVEKRARRFAIRLWLGFCGLAIFGHLAGGWIGLLTITLPAIALFWIGLYRISAYILPLRNKSQRGQVFRSLLTFSMDTNYPYYFVDANGQLDKRVEGNAVLQFFAGPGIVYTDCDHATYVSNGIFNNRVFEPGLNFSDRFDQPPQIVDLRPQLRIFSVEALTKDGISVNVLTFIPFKIDSGGQAQLGQSFPIRHKAIHAAITSGLTERTDDNHSVPKHEWDGQLVPLTATPIVQDVISEYNIDELCVPGNRTKITDEVVNRLTEALQPVGLKVIGGGIGNLVPKDEIVIEKRLDNWRTEWERKILEQLGPDKHEYLMELDWAKTEADIIKRLAEVAEKSEEGGNPLLLHLIDSLGEFIGPSRRH